MTVQKPYVPTPPQLAEAEALLNTLQEIQEYLKSTQPRAELTHKSQRLHQKLAQKIQQSRQRVQQWGPTEPDLFAAQRSVSAFAPSDTRAAEAIWVLTQELGPLPSGKSVQGKPTQLRPAQGKHSVSWVSEGPDVKCLQQFLAFAGFAVPDTGHFDGATGQALKQWQRQQALPTSGRLDGATRPVLNQHLNHWRQVQGAEEQLQTLLQAAQQDWEHLTGATASADFQTRLQQFSHSLIQVLRDGLDPADIDLLKSRAFASDLPYFKSCMSTPGLAHIVHQGPEVEQLQRVLLAANCDTKVSGRFDLETFTALKHFQKLQGLAETGETDYATLTHLNQWVLKENWYHQQSQQIRDFLANFAGAVSKNSQKWLGFEALMAPLKPH